MSAAPATAASAGWTEELVVIQLAATKETAGLAKTMASDAYNVLINTVVASGLSQSTIDGYKQTASSQENSLLNAINSLTQNQKTISDSKLDSSSSGISSSASVNNAKASLDTAKNNLETAKNSLNQTISDNKKSLDSAKNELATKKISYENAKIQLEQKTAAPREVDLASARVQVAQAKQDYEDALENLADAEVKSPIDGVVAKVNQKVGYAASASDSNSSNSIATIITDQQLAVISLNEVDIAKVKTGQKAMLTFTAIEDLELTGQVVEIDNLGTDTQGVVSYEVKINLDNQDERVKSQMSVSAEIITESSTDVLVIDSNAIKTDNDNLSYVEVFENKKLASGDSFNTTETPTKKYIEVGITNDTKTEITGGLSEGDVIVIQTSSISSSENKASTKTSTNQRSGLQMMGGGMNMGAGGPPDR
ncbi:MAG TPA: HlyD family efflux transporter periplasmic adaptor subunit [bacterium]|nr:HlyD family efflux transporter periplasmic adaptor subunit [bacterium]